MRKFIQSLRSWRYLCLGLVQAFLVAEGAAVVTPSGGLCLLVAGKIGGVRLKASQAVLEITRTRYRHRIEGGVAAQDEIYVHGMRQLPSSEDDLGVPRTDEDVERSFKGPFRTAMGLGYAKKKVARGEKKKAGAWSPETLERLEQEYDEWKGQAELLTFFSGEGKYLGSIRHVHALPGSFQSKTHQELELPVSRFLAGLDAVRNSEQGQEVLPRGMDFIVERVPSIDVEALRRGDFDSVLDHSKSTSSAIEGSTFFISPGADANAKLEVSGIAHASYLLDSTSGEKAWLDHFLSAHYPTYVSSRVVERQYGAVGYRRLSDVSQRYGLMESDPAHSSELHPFEERRFREEWTDELGDEQETLWWPLYTNPAIYLSEVEIPKLSKLKVMEDGKLIIKDPNARKLLRAQLNLEDGKRFRGSFAALAHAVGSLETADGRKGGLNRFWDAVVELLQTHKDMRTLLDGFSQEFGQGTQSRMQDYLNAHDLYASDIREVFAQSMTRINRTGTVDDLWGQITGAQHFLEATLKNPSLLDSAMLSRQDVIKHAVMPALKSEIREISDFARSVLSNFTSPEERAL